MNKKKSSPWIPLIVALVACASFISSSGDEEPAIIFASIAVVLVITLAVLAAQKAKAKKTEARNGDSIPDDPRMKTFTKPDAPCVVCEHTGEDHLARDKQNRIRQLDDWLKSGLIDRADPFGSITSALWLGTFFLAARPSTVSSSKPTGLLLLAHLRFPTFLLRRPTS